MGWFEKRSRRLKRLAHRRARQLNKREDFCRNDYKAIIKRTWSWNIY